MTSVKTFSSKIKTISSSFMEKIYIFDIFYHKITFGPRIFEVWKGKNLCPLGVKCMDPYWEIIWGWARLIPRKFSEFWVGELNFGKEKGDLTNFILNFASYRYFSWRIYKCPFQNQGHKTFKVQMINLKKDRRWAFDDSNNLIRKTPNLISRNRMFHPRIKFVDVVSKK